MFHVKRAAWRVGRAAPPIYFWQPEYLRIGRSDRPRGSSISSTSALIAVGVGVLHAGLAPVIEIAGVRPNLVLVAVVLVTILWGFESGIAWAFVAGLTANLLVHDPLGAIPLALLIAAGVATVGERLFGRVTWFYPIAAVFAASILADAVSLIVLRLIDGSPGFAIPLGLVVPSAVLNAAIAGLLLYPARRLALRLGVEEKAAW
jgi:rod shape-determining protein MreD